MIYYNVNKRKNPQTGTEKFYGTVNIQSNVDLEDIAEEIAYSTTATEADVKAVLSSLQKYIIEHLKNGQSVRLGDLGSFRTTMTSTGVADKDKFTASQIKRVRARFTPSSRIQSSLQLKNLTFKQVGAASSSSSSSSDTSGDVDPNA
jgi:predicted histone-like DNA-binding protein